MKSRPLSADSLSTPEEAVFGISSSTHVPPFIKIASHVGGRDGLDPPAPNRDHFRRPPFLRLSYYICGASASGGLSVHFLLGVQKKVNDSR